MIMAAPRRSPLPMAIRCNPPWRIVAHHGGALSEHAQPDHLDPTCCTRLLSALGLWSGQMQCLRAPALSLLVCRPTGAFRVPCASPIGLMPK